MSYPQVLNEFSKIRTLKPVLPSKSSHFWNILTIQNNTLLWELVSLIANPLPTLLLLYNISRNYQNIQTFAGVLKPYLCSKLNRVL